MDGATLKTMCESILDDTVDEVLFYQLANIAKNLVEDERPWMFLRSLDSSQSASTGNYSETSKALPTSWRRTYKLMVGRDQLYEQVPFDEQHLWRFTSNRFVVDVANSVYYLLGPVGAGGTIYHYYIKTTPDIDESTSPMWPSRFHGLVAHDVAAFIMAGVDADDQFARMSPTNSGAAERIREAMREWDQRLQLDAQNNQQQVANSAPYLDLGMM